MACAVALSISLACDSPREKGDAEVDWRTVVDNAEEHNGFRFNGFRFNGFRFNGFRFNGFRFNGFRFNGEELTNVHMDDNILCGEDSLGTLLSGAELDGATFNVDFVDPEDPSNTAVLEFELSDSEMTATGLTIATVRHRELPSEEWVDSCDNGAKAVLLRGDWDPITGDPISTDPDALTFACLGGSLGDCAVWGYIPGEDYNGTALSDYHETCTRLKRADYCGEGTHHTENGHVIDVYDALAIQTSATDWPVEAMWGPDGAICSNFSRILDYSTDINSPVHQYVGCDLPSCEDINGDGEVDFLDYPAALMADRTVPTWGTRDFTIYTLFRRWDGLIFRKSMDGGNSFSPGRKVTGDFDEEELFPKVTVDDSGNIHLIFVGSVGAPVKALRHSVSTDGGINFSIPRGITPLQGPLYCSPDEIGTSTEYRLEVVHDISGSVHVFYNQTVYDKRRVFHVKSSDNGSSWSAPVLLDSALQDSFLRNSIVDSSGNIHVLYNERNAGSWKLFYRKSSDGGESWSTPTMINVGVNSAFSAEMVLDSGGNPHIAYQEGTGPVSLLLYRKSVDGGDSFAAPSSVIDVANCNDPSRCRIESVRLRLDSNELPHIAYESLLDFDQRLFYVNSPDGATFSSPVAIDETRIDNWHLLKVHFFLTADDQPIITWQDMHLGPGKFAGYITISEDGGATFKAPRPITSLGRRTHEFDATQGPDGKLYVMYSEFDAAKNGAVMYFKRLISGDNMWFPIDLSADSVADYPIIYIK